MLNITYYLNNVRLCLFYILFFSDDIKSGVKTNKICLMKFIVVVNNHKNLVMTTENN